MRVGILGSGLMGGKLGTLFARAGHEVVFSYARSAEKLKRLAKDAKGKARAGTPEEAAQDADAVLLAVHWLRIDDVLHQAGNLSGMVTLSCSLPMDAGNTGLVIGHTTSGAEELVKRIPKAKVVHGNRSSAHAASNRTPTWLRGLVVLCPPAFGSVRRTRAVGIPGSCAHARVALCR